VAQPTVACVPTETIVKKLSACVLYEIVQMVEHKTASCWSYHQICGASLALFTRTSATLQNTTFGWRKTRGFDYGRWMGRALPIYLFIFVLIFVTSVIQNNISIVVTKCVFHEWNWKNSICSQGSIPSHTERACEAPWNPLVGWGGESSSTSLASQFSAAIYRTNRHL